LDSLRVKKQIEFLLQSKFLRILNISKIAAPQSRIRKKFLRFFLGAGILPLVLMGFISLYLVDRTHRIDIANLERTIISEKAVEIEKFINEAVGLFRLQVAYEEYAEISIKDQEFLLGRMLEENPYLEEVSFISLSGEETSKKIKSGNEVKLSQRILDNAFIFAKDGKDYFGPVEFEKDGPKIKISSPVLNRKNQIIAVLSGKINLRPIQESISNTILGSTGYIYLTDKDGNVILHSKNSWIGKNIKNLKIVSDVLGGIERDGLGREDLYLNIEGEKVFGAGNLLKNLNWAIIAEWPFEDAQKVVGAIVIQFISWTSLALILVFFVSGILALQLIKPITILKNSAKEIGEGKFDTRIYVKTGDEIEELAHSINKMAENLKQLEELRELKLRAQFLAEALAKERELSKIKDQFITVASHQLLTPLSVIGWSIESLKMESLSEDVRQHLVALSKGREDLLAIVDDLLTISEIGFNYKNSSDKKVLIEDVVRKSIDKFKKRIEEKKLNIFLEMPEEKLYIRADEIILSKAIDQIVDNSITYSHDGGRIWIKIEKDFNNIKISIRDEGIGIPKEEQSFVFKEFFRAKNSVIKKNVGTGLGLFIVKTIIEGHGGKVSFESEENKGTTFFVYLPIFN
jgi:signal transduction histidine kinase